MSENKSLPSPALREKLAEIPRGNTCPGVNRQIIEIMLSLETDFSSSAILDVPCGAGDFLRTVKNFFPGAETFGADIAEPTKNFPGKFLKIDASRDNLFDDATKFQIITCISGVMEFDNTQLFFEKLRANLDKNGLLIVTNDNLVSVRDRILYLLFGRFRQYKAFIKNDSPTWKTLHLQTLTRILSEAKFEATEIKYIPFGAGEWIWLPLAAVIYVLQLIYFQTSETHISFAEKRALFPFRSLLSRHYIVVCRAENR